MTIYQQEFARWQKIFSEYEVGQDCDREKNGDVAMWLPGLSGDFNPLHTDKVLQKAHHSVSEVHGMLVTAFRRVFHKHWVSLKEQQWDCCNKPSYTNATFWRHHSS